MYETLNCIEGCYGYGLREVESLTAKNIKKYKNFASSAFFRIQELRLSMNLRGCNTDEFFFLNPQKMIIWSKIQTGVFPYSGVFTFNMIRDYLS